MPLKNVGNMSEPQKRDIASFFRPYARTIPRKRPSPDPDGDTIVVNIAAPIQPKTPGKTPNRRHATPFRNVPSPERPRFSPLQTPKSGRSVSIPIRSPIPLRTGTPASSRRPLFERVNNPTQQLPSTDHSFSFSDLKSSEQRIVQDGVLVGVRDSDDDTDSLESLRDIFDRRKAEDVTSNSSPPDVDGDKQESERLRLLSMYQKPKAAPIVHKDKLRKLLKSDRNTQSMFDNTLQELFEDQELEASIARHREEYEISTRELDATGQAEISKRILTGIARENDDAGDNVSRLLNAVERTDALSTEKSFSFFGPSGMNDWSEEPIFRREYPRSSAEKSLWRPNDEKAQQRCFLSGLMTEKSASGDVSDKAMKWIFDSVTEEPNNELRHAYVQCIRAGSSMWTRNNLTAIDVHTAFQSLGADPDVIREGTTLRSKFQPVREPPQRNAKYLLAALDLLTSICQDMDFTALSKLCSITARLSLDSRSMSNTSICHAVEELLEKLCGLPDHESRQHVHERMLSDLGRNLREPVLQAKLLSHLLPSSPATSQIRSELAMTFLLDLEIGSSSSAASHSASNSPLKALARHVTSSRNFSTTRHKGDDPTDYTALKARLSILDAAIADGYPPVMFSSPAEEKEFNDTVDVLCNRLHSLFVSIADSGASHMRRTECKDALQALEFRVLFTVRTKPRKKKHVFDLESGKMRDSEAVNEAKRGSDFMKQFLQKNKQQLKDEMEEVKISTTQEPGTRSEMLMQSTA